MFSDKIENIKKLFAFSWSQAFSDSNGKSTIMPVSGFYMVILGGLGFGYGAITKDAGLVNQSIVLSTLGASVLMGRKIINGKPGELPNIDDTK